MHRPPKGLYVLFDPRTRDDWVETLIRLEQVAGVRMFQLRAKGATQNAMIEWARLAVDQLQEACLVINDDPEVALKAGAGGVHVGPEDAWPNQVRKKVGSQMLIGASGDNAARLLDPRTGQADYFGVGTFRTTATKPNAGRALGIAGVARALALTDKPVYVIGGVRSRDIQTLKVIGIWGIAVYSGVWETRDPVAAARLYLEVWQA